MARVAMGDEILDQRQSRRIEPLQVVDKNNQRVLWPREDADETLEYQLKPKCRFGRRECGHRRGWTDQADKLRNEIRQQDGMIAHHFWNGVAPTADIFLIAIQDLANEPLERLGQRGIRDVFKTEIEFPRDEDAARQHDRLVKFVDDGRLADARIARNQQKFRLAVGYDAVERFQQCGNLSFPPVELLRDDQSIRGILFA